MVVSYRAFTVDHTLDQVSISPVYSYIEFTASSVVKPRLAVRVMVSSALSGQSWCKDPMLLSNSFVSSETHFPVHIWFLSCKKPGLVPCHP